MIFRHPSSGSFIRLAKANFGVSCPEAIKVRYGFIDDELAGIDRETIASVQKSLNAPFVEMVGFSKVNKKQSTFEELKIICVQDQCISNAGFPGDLAALCPKVEELDLSQNLLNNWETIVEICVQLPVLTHLNVRYSISVHEMIFFLKIFHKNIKHVKIPVATTYLLMMK